MSRSIWAAHHLGAAHRAAQHGLVEDGPEGRRLGLGEQFLALHAQVDPALDLLVGLVGEADAQHRAGVVVGLQQARDVVRLVGPDDGGLALQADVGAEPVGQHVAVLVPPARRLASRARREEVVDLRGRRRRRSAVTPSHRGCLRPTSAFSIRRTVKGVTSMARGGLLERHPRLFPQVPQALAQDHPQDGGGTAAGAALAHVLPPRSAVTACSVPRRFPDTDLRESIDMKLSERLVAECSCRTHSEHVICCTSRFGTSTRRVRGGIGALRAWPSPLPWLKPGLGMGPAGSGPVCLHDGPGRMRP